MHQDPFGKVRWIREFDLQRREIQIPLLRLRVVTLEAMLLQERAHVRRNAVTPKRGQSQRSAKAG